MGSSVNNKQIGVLGAFLWNSSGIGFYFVCKWLLTVFTVRMGGGFEDAGHLALAMSVTNVFYCISLYNIRNYQVSDIEGKFSDGVYIATRFVTTISATALCALYSIVFISDRRAAAVVCIYMLLMASEAFADVYHGIAQKRRRMDIVGISCLLRGAAVISVFFVLYGTSGIIPAVSGISISAILLVIFYDAMCVKKLTTPFDTALASDNENHSQRNYGANLLNRRRHTGFPFFSKSWNLSLNRDVVKLLRICFPLMATLAMFILFSTVARVFLANETSAETLGAYNSATIPAVIVMQASSLLFTPFVNELAEHYSKKRFKAFNRLFLMLSGAVLLIATAGFGAAGLFGEALLDLLYGKEIIPYAYLLTEAMIVSGLTGFLWLVIMALTVMRKLGLIALGSAAGLIVCVLSARRLFSAYGLSGANYMQMLGLSTAAGILLAVYLIKIQRNDEH